jgi:hypothetical protein
MHYNEPKRIEANNGVHYTCICDLVGLYYIIFSNVTNC